MTRGAREKESASQALEEPDIAEERANGIGRIETEEGGSYETQDQNLL
jgi:hypothetical protein